MIVNLGSKKGKKNDNSSPQITCLYNSSLMSIVETLENNLSKVDSEIWYDKSTNIFSKVIIKIIFLFNTCTI